MTALGYGSDLAHVSTIDDVIVEVQRLFTAVTDPTVFILGESHDNEDGAPPRVRIVTGELGSLGGPPRLGYVAGITEGTACYVWGDPALADGNRERAAKALGVRLINAFKRAASGRLTGASLKTVFGTKFAKYGEEVQVLLSYTWGVPKDAAIWRVPSTDQTLTPRLPDMPDGPTGKTYHVTTHTDPSRS